MWNCFACIVVFALSVRQSHPLRCSDSDVTSGAITCYDTVKTLHHVDAGQIVPRPEPVFSTSNTLSPPPANLTQRSRLISVGDEKFLLAKHKLISDVYANKSILFQKIIKREIVLTQNATDGLLVATKQGKDNNAGEMSERIHTSSTSASNQMESELSSKMDQNVVDAGTNASSNESDLNDTNGIIIGKAETCDERENASCIIDHTVVCVGDPQYCNLTKDEYMDLLYEYITPTTAELILIVSHCIVFTMGLVSNRIEFH